MSYTLFGMCPFVTHASFWVFSSEHSSSPLLFFFQSSNLILNESVIEFRVLGTLFIYLFLVLGFSFDPALEFLFPAEIPNFAFFFSLEYLWHSYLKSLPHNSII